jgi:hypothetical protein
MTIIHDSVDHFLSLSKNSIKYQNFNNPEKNFNILKKVSLIFANTIKFTNFFEVSGSIVC